MFILVLLMVKMDMYVSPEKEKKGKIKASSFACLIEIYGNEITFKC